MENKKKLTVWESACIITGYGVGGGVLSMPYMAERNGFLVAMLVLLAALAASYVLHLMIADLALKTEGGQIVSCMSKYLFRGKLKTFMTIFFFGMMALILCTNLAVYIAGAEEILVDLLGVSPLVAQLLFYVAAASVVMFGLKAVGVSEKVAVGAIFALVGLLAVASMFAERHPVPMVGGSMNTILAYYGTAMFAMAAFFSVPQAVEGLGHDEKAIKKAVFLGLMNNFVLIVVITFFALLASEEVTEVCMVGWSKGIGAWAQVIGSVFTVLAMLTTYWSISLALSSIVEEQLKLNTRICWLLATLPSLVLALLNMGGFMEFMRLAGGLISILVAVTVVPAFRNAEKDIPGSLLGKHTGIGIQILVVVAYVLMGVGSVVTI